jgi:hypothetical protein
MVVLVSCEWWREDGHTDKDFYKNDQNTIAVRAQSAHPNDFLHKSLGAPVS